MQISMLHLKDNIYNFLRIVQYIFISYYNLLYNLFLLYYIINYIYALFSSFLKRDVVEFSGKWVSILFSRGAGLILETGLLLFFNRRFKISSSLWLYHSSLSGFASESRTGETPLTRRATENVGRVLRISTFVKLCWLE